MDKYDSGKMRACAQDIRNELKNYSAAKKENDDIVTKLRNNWKDDINTTYSQKYNSEAKVSAENVETLMKAFADLLDETAAALEKVKTTAEQGM